MILQCTALELHMTEKDDGRAAIIRHKGGGGGRWCCKQPNCNHRHSAHICRTTVQYRYSSKLKLHRAATGLVVFTSVLSLLTCLHLPSAHARCPWVGLLVGSPTRGHILLLVDSPPSAVTSNASTEVMHPIQQHDQRTSSRRVVAALHSTVVWITRTQSEPRRRSLPCFSFRSPSFRTTFSHSTPWHRRPDRQLDRPTTTAASAVAAADA